MNVGGSGPDGRKRNLLRTEEPLRASSWQSRPKVLDITVSPPDAETLGDRPAGLGNALPPPTNAMTEIAFGTDAGVLSPAARLKVQLHDEGQHFPYGGHQSGHRHPVT